MALHGLERLVVVLAEHHDHEVRVEAIDEAIAARDAGDERVILFGLSGHGAFDLQAYDDYLNGRLPEVEYRQEDVEAAMSDLPDVPIPGEG